MEMDLPIIHISRYAPGSFVAEPVSDEFGHCRISPTTVKTPFNQSEDFGLRGFVTRLPAQSILDFSRKHSLGIVCEKERKPSVKRILAAGKALANVVDELLEQSEIDV